MKKIFIALLITFGVYKYLFYIPSSPNNTPIYNVSSYSETTEETPYSEISPENPTISFKCDGRQHCSQMRSYEEAKFFLQNCPKVKMDGDHDGVPCERQFGRYD